MNIAKMIKKFPVLMVGLSIFLSSSTWAQSELDKRLNAFTNAQLPNAISGYKPNDPAWKVNDISNVYNAQNAGSLVGADAEIYKKNGLIRVIEAEVQKKGGSSVFSVQLIEFWNQNAAASAAGMLIGDQGYPTSTKTWNIPSQQESMISVGPFLYRIRNKGPVQAGVKAELRDNLQKRMENWLKAKQSESKYYKKYPDNEVYATFVQKFKNWGVATYEEPVGPLNYIGVKAWTIRKKNSERYVFLIPVKIHVNKLKGKKMYGEKQSVREFISKYKNRFRYYKTDNGGLGIIGKYKGYIMGVYDKQNPNAPAGSLKKSIENVRKKYFFN